MASFLDSLFDSLAFKSIRPPAPAGVPLPAPNPLRGPAPTPQVNGGASDLLGSLLQLPDLSWMVTDQDNPSTRRAKATERENEARSFYNAEGVQIPLPERGARTNQGNAGSTSTPPDNSEEGNVDDTADEEVPVPERSPLAGGGASAVRGPDGQVRVPVRPAGPVADPFRAMMLQMGLSLMTPSWGNTMSQIGQAVGQGAAAGGRAVGLNEAEERRVEAQADKDEDRAVNNRLREAQTEKTLAETETERSGESSRARRLRGKQPTIVDEAAAAAGLGPKGKAYFAQKLKGLNAEDILGTEDADPTEKFNKIIEEAKKLDAPSAPAKAPNVGGTETVTGMPVVKSLEEARKLKSGTKFMIEMNGKTMIGTAP